MEQVENWGTLLVCKCSISQNKVPDLVDYTVNESTDEFLIVVSRQQLSKINIESITVGESVIKQV